MNPLGILKPPHVRVTPAPWLFSGRLTTNSQASGSTTCKREGRAVSVPLRVPTPECGLVWGCIPGLFHLCWQHLSSWPREALVTGDIPQPCSALDRVAGLTWENGGQAEARPSCHSCRRNEIAMATPAVAFHPSTALPSPVSHKTVATHFSACCGTQCPPRLWPSFPKCSSLPCPFHHPSPVHAKGSPLKWPCWLPLTSSREGPGSQDTPKTSSTCKEAWGVMTGTETVPSGVGGLQTGFQNPEIRIEGR